LRCAAQRVLVPALRGSESVCGASLHVGGSGSFARALSFWRDGWHIYTF